MLTRRHLLFASLAAAAPRPVLAQPSARRADHLIVLWMQGGASHIDTFDPKTGHRDAGPFRAIPTRTEGLSICEHLPQLAAQSEKYSVIRSMQSKEGNHERARYLGHTGYAKNPTVAHPSLGAWLVHDRPVQPLPRFVSVGGPSHGPGFLGVEHAPFIVPKAGELPANASYGFGVDAERFRRRRRALDFVEDRFAERSPTDTQRSRRAVFDRADAMMHGETLGAFALDEEPAALQRAYGDHDFGRGCLLARRLVEAGARVVEVTLGGWDTHYDNFSRSRDRMALLDGAMATLLQDLHDRSLLDRTLVVWMGDFGRTPRINARDGRDHHPRAWSTVVAGGGIRGGLVHGATDARGEAVTRDAVGVPDLFATLAHCMGTSPSLTKTAPGGRPISLTDYGSPIRSLLR